jgi:multicomponent Na+:H+ antiporter subunit C
MNALAYAVAAWVFAVGIYGGIVSRNLIHLALCLTVAQSSSYILLLSAGYRKHSGAPVFKGEKLGTPSVDPIVQALTLTDIVVSVTIVALILAIALNVHRRSGSVNPDEIATLNG